MTVDSEEFLISYVKFSGWLEIGFGVLFLFMGPIFELLGIPVSPFFPLAAGVMIITLGFLLWYSARDLERYLIITVSSCVFRFAMAPIEFYCLFAIPILTPIWIFGFSYDIFSAALTLFLLKRVDIL